MSKVVHLSNEAHQRAKDYCAERGLKMSDWVADLILATIAGDGPKPARQDAPEVSAPPPASAPARPMGRPASVARTVATTTHTRVAVVEKKSNGNAGPKKKPLPRIESKPQMTDSGLAPWEAPPFWTQDSD